MKLSEVIAKLEENPKQKFVPTQEPDNYIYIGEGGLLKWKDGQVFTINLNTEGYSGTLEKYEWKLVPEPVDFITAINSGKHIRPVNLTNWNYREPKDWLNIVHADSNWLEYINGFWEVEC